MAHVFISYQRADSKFAQYLKKQVEDNGFRVWMDAEVRAGDNWRETIDEAIKEAFAAVIILSKASRHSEYVNYEWAYALGANIKVVLIMFEEVEVHPRLAVLQYLDFTDWHNLPWDRLMRRLKEIEQQHFAQQTAANIPADAPQALKSAVAALDSYNADERIAAVDALSQMNHPVARDVLAAAVHHTMGDVRIHAAFTLTRVADNRDPRAVPGLIEALRDKEHPATQREAVQALGDIGDPLAVPELVNMLDERDENLKGAIVEAIGKIGTEAIPDVVEKLNAEDWRVRRNATEALWLMRDPETVPGLVTALTDWHDVVRHAASGALAELGYGAVYGLTQIMNGKYGKNRDLQNAALYALEEIIATPEALQAATEFRTRHNRPRE